MPNNDGHHFLISDILQCRKPTDHISETIFDIEKKQWHFIDIAGQLDKRPKWVPYFEDGNAILFVASAASYDQVTDEIPGVNQFIDSLVLFENIVNHPSLKNASIILFLNKVDLLRQKLKRSPVSQHILYYKGCQIL